MLGPFLHGTFSLGLWVLGFLGFPVLGRAWRSRSQSCLSLVSTLFHCIGTVLLRISFNGADESMTLRVMKLVVIVNHDVDVEAGLEKQRQ